MTPEQRQAVYHAWLKAPGHFNEIDLIRMAEEATLADRERQAGEAVAWPEELSSISRTQPVRFNVIYRDDGEPMIDDDDFKFDALIKVHGDFDEGEKEKYVAEVCRRLNGAAAPSPDGKAEQAEAPCALDRPRWDSPLTDFEEGQWWVLELDAMVRNGTVDQKRAVAVVHHLLRAALATQPTASPEQAEAPSDKDRADYWRGRAIVAERKLATQPTASPEQAEAPGDARLTGTVHELKTDWQVFGRVVRGLKLFEIRKDDRGFKVGDLLRLRETAWSGAEMAAGQPLIYTGQEHTVRVIDIVRGPVYGLADGWVIMSIASLPKPGVATQPTASNAGEREAFEAHALSDKHDVTRMLANPEIYDCNYTQVMWEGWQLKARAALASKPPAGEHVPVRDDPWRGAEVLPYSMPQPEQVAQDSVRLDWLCDQYVTVRTPLRYGSKECFLGSPDDNDGESVPWDIRAAIDAARARGEKGGA